jgi:hypothetical protein
VTRDELLAMPADLVDQLEAVAKAVTLLEIKHGRDDQDDAD